MTPVTWLALAGLAAVAALPSAATGRVAVLAGDGRLRAGPGGPSRRVRIPAPVAAVAGGSLVLLVAAVAGVALAIAAAAVTGLGVLLVRDAVGRRAEHARQRELLTAVRVLAGELVAGARPADALGAAAGTGAGARALLSGAAVAAEGGGDPAAELAASPVAGVRALGASWRLVESTGAALAEVVERVATDLAAGDARRHAVAVALAGPRASALMISGLPLIGIVLGAAMGARPLDFLFGDPVGRALCCGGVLLDVAGMLWIRAVVRRAECR